MWRNEAADFTPWLQEHPEHLAEVLGIGIELTYSEHAVGGFSLDILGRDLAHDATLIVENQLAGTDHDHLGKLLTYAAGTGTATIVWIATDIREEHRQAIDWLNEHTDEQVRFFAVRLQIVRIGGSPPAPLLDVVAQPNDWQRQVRAATRASTTVNEAQLLSAVDDAGYRAALEALLDDCRRLGLSLEWEAWERRSACAHRTGGNHCPSDGCSHQVASAGCVSGTSTSGSIRTRSRATRRFDRQSRST